MGGCSKILWIFVGLLFFVFALENPALWIVVAVGVGGGIIATWLSNRKNREESANGMESQANLLEALATDKVPTNSLAMALNKGETPIYVIESVALTEYESTGSTFSGGTAGVSFPLTENIRGNVGGMKGSFTKNPEQLMVVDQGRAIFTDQRIVFSGAKFVRDWDLKNTVSLEPGINGFDVKIAVTNRDRTSGLQRIGPQELGPGFVAAYVFNLSQNGKEQANKWALELVVQLREMVASERAALAK
jgi:hypothetical protein